MENSKIVNQYRKWIIQRGTETFPITENEKGNLEIESINSLGCVNFYENDIVELVINTIPDNEVAFFLHFQLNDLDHAKELYYDFEQVMQKTKDEGVTNILLTCSSALTTSYYVELLNEAANTLGLKYSFRAVSLDKIAEEGKSEDVILLAPQVHYARKKIVESFKDKIVINIPPQIFGKYNTAELITLIEGELNEHDLKTTPKAKRTKAFFETNKKILTIGYAYDLENGHYHRVIYRYYKNGHIEFSKEIFLDNVAVEDMSAIIQETLNLYPEIEIIGLAIPGTIENGIVHHEGTLIHMQNVVDILQKKFQKMVFAFNDANMIVTGIYWLEDLYKSLTLYYLPYGSSIAGMGLVINGHLIRGRQHVAGEMKYLQKVLDLKQDSENLADTEKGNLELISKSIVSLIATVGPEAIFIYSYKLKDMDKLRKELEKYIENDYIPDLILLNNIDEYMMTGTFLRCIWKMDDIQRMKYGLTHNPYI